MKIKTMLAILFAGIFSVSTFAATQYAKEQLPEFEKKLAEAKTPFQKFGAAVRIKVGFSEITSFEQIKTISEQVAKEYNITDRERIDSFVISAGFWWWDFQFRTEALKMAIQTKNKQQYYAVLVFEKIVNTLMSPTERFAIIKEGLENKQFKPERIVHAIEKMCEIGEKIEKQDELKTTLQKLNRIYTPMLAKDKANYEKVVAYIRLALNAY